MFKEKSGMFGLSPGELGLWCGSAGLVLLAFLLFDGEAWLTLAASLVGVTSLIFNARGNPVGQALMLLFSGLYGIISYDAAYYGEMITYLGMTAPMALFALISWLKNPYQGRRSEVQVARLCPWELWLLPLMTVAVTGGFYFILRALHTANLPLSTVSVATSFLAAYLTFRRSAFFPLAYAANDVVLLGLWAAVARQEPAGISMLACFSIFLVNDLYGFFSWRKMQQRQRPLSPEGR